MTLYNNKLVKTGAYVRVSHDEQKKHGFSVEAQKEGLQKYANENGYIIVEWYIDEAKSARKKSKTRKELMRLVEDAKQNKFEMIIFKCIDRWFRNIQEYYKIQSILESHNINWECSEEEYDTTTREGRLKLNLYLMLAQDEADKGSERIKYVFDSKIKNGEAIFGTSSLPIGYKVEVINDKKRVVINEEERNIVEDIFKTYETTLSKRKTLFLINEKYDLDIKYTSLTLLLKNSLFYGCYKDNENYVYGDSYLTKDKWNHIQELMTRDIKSSSKKYVYTFSSLLKCPKCGDGLVGGVSTGTDKKKRFYYRCNNKYLNNNCDIKNNLSEDKVEKRLLQTIKPEIEKYIASFEVKPIKKDKPKIDVNKLKKELDRLNNMYVKARIDEETYDSLYNEISDKIKAASIEEVKPKDLTYLKDLLNSDIETIYNSLSKEEQRVFWRSFIKEVTIDPNFYDITDIKML